MATYAIGDIQGCWRTLERLLGRIGFDPDRDRLWLVGDLVNRGPLSLEVLRWARSLGSCLTAVLGNHDLHLIALADGVVRKRRPRLRAILEAPDREELVAWLRTLPLIHRQGEYVMVHAGLHPDWSVEQALALAGEAEAVLRSGETGALFEALGGELPQRWKESLSGTTRAAFVLSILTTLRLCTPGGRVCPGHTGSPETAPAGCIPWFDVPDRKSSDHILIAGHWAMLGLCRRERFYGLDTGCVYGNSLTALRLEDRTLFQEPLADRVD